MSANTFDVYANELAARAQAWGAEGSAIAGQVPQAAVELGIPIKQ